MNLRALVLAAAATGTMLSSGATAADAKKGKKVYRKCIACHSIKKGAPHKIGPNLFGIVGSPSGNALGYTYSKAMKMANLTWDEATLDVFIKKPKKLIKKTKMSFVGIRKNDQRANLIAYLKTLTD